MKKNLPKINNHFYDSLGEKWHKAFDHPVAFLRAENACRNPWIIKTIAKHFTSPCSVLDVGCGAGLLAHPLAQEGHQVFGVDLSSKSLEIAQTQDSTKSICYLHADAYELPFPDKSFEVVCAMDILEHLEEPEQAIKEISRVLKPSGLFFFHTFNRTFWSWLTVIKGVEWMVANTPSDMHVFHLFIKPRELKQMCQRYFLSVHDLKGLNPRMHLSALWNMYRTKRVPEQFTFRFTRSLRAGYIGYAVNQKDI